MWDYASESVRKSSGSKSERKCCFYRGHGHMWVGQDWGRLTRELMWCKGIWEAGGDDTWPFEASQGIEVKATPGGLQNHLTFLISDGPNKKKPEKVRITLSFIPPIYWICVFKVFLCLFIFITETIIVLVFIKVQPQVSFLNSLFLQVSSGFQSFSNCIYIEYPSLCC